MSQKRTFLSKWPLMTHCSVHTMSLQLDPANTVFMPAQVRGQVTSGSTQRETHGATKHAQTLLRRSHSFRVRS